MSIMDFIYQKDKSDENIYATGRIHGYDVVVACLPSGTDGCTQAAKVATNMKRTFPDIPIHLLVGIGGGIPDLERGKDVRLGDVVVSLPTGEHGGVIQYGKGKLKDSEGKPEPFFERKGSLDKPKPLLRSALIMIRAEHLRRSNKILCYINEALEREPFMKQVYGFPGRDRDCLHDAKPKPSLLNDTESVYAEVHRPDRASDIPVIHYGNIASGDIVIKDAQSRDSLRDKYEAICVEMEAAGIVDTFGCLVIRGICDYADSFKNDQWHHYAALVAAAYAKELLYFLSSPCTRKTQETSTTSQTSNDNYLADLFNRANQKLKIPKTQASHKDLHDARRAFLTVCHAWERGSAGPEKMVRIYNKLAMTFWDLSFANVGYDDRLNHVIDAQTYNDLALEQALIIKNPICTAQMRFYIACVNARYAAMTDITSDELANTLAELEDCLKEVRYLHSANAEKYSEMASTDMARLRTQLANLQYD